jgi:8-oxo-dGTP pyrophosphatase MutT (NUDIX family)
VLGPENLRVYGILLRNGRVLISAERVAERDVLKFPGGAVEPAETPERALVREFREEGALVVTPVRLLHVPGTLLSPWTHANYTPIYYEVRGDGDPVSPPHEPLELRFMEPGEAMRSGRMADPEILALRRALDDDG